MRRVLMFEDHDKPAHMKVNGWLATHPHVTLVDIKPIMVTSINTRIYAIVEASDEADDGDAVDAASKTTVPANP